jgi:hypothetical protein
VCILDWGLLHMNDFDFAQASPVTRYGRSRSDSSDSDTEPPGPPNEIARTAAPKIAQVGID